MLRYLAGTRNLGISYGTQDDNNDDENHFHGYANAAFANADGFKSTSGYVFIAAGGAITWRSKKQTVIALSTTEAEYIALCEAGREACWLRNLYSELGLPQKSPTTIKGDNDSSISLAKEAQFHNRSKHIAIRYHWIRNLVNDEEIIIEDCRDPDQTADVLTKAIPKPKHERHTGEMGVREVATTPSRKQIM